jgi:hypothetical protein
MLSWTDIRPAADEKALDESNVDAKERRREQVRKAQRYAVGDHRGIIPLTDSF